MAKVEKLASSDQLPCDWFDYIESLLTQKAGFHDFRKQLLACYWNHHSNRVESFIPVYAQGYGHYAF